MTSILHDGFTTRQRRRFLSGRRDVLYLIATQSRCRGPLLDGVRELVDGGIAAVQLREKNATDADIVDLAMRLRSVLVAHDVPLVLNDRLDLVARSGASGVHLGKNDATVSDARRYLGPDAIIGATAHSIEEAVEAERAGADYLGVGPVFTSRTKQISAPRGTDWLGTVVRAVRIPCFAVGGVSAENIASVAEAGVYGAAVCEALLGAVDRRSAASSMRSLLGSVDEGDGELRP